MLPTSSPPDADRPNVPIEAERLLRSLTGSGLPPTALLYAAVLSDPKYDAGVERWWAKSASR